MRRVCLILLFSLMTIAVTAQTYDQKLFGGMHWRNIGPFRGGRALAVTGIPGEPNTYIFGAVAGGIWKSTDGGVNWKPLFEHESTSSIGAIAVADSDHNVIYAGTGEACIRGNMSYGDGVFKSLDGAQSRKNIGLRDTQHIGAVIIDPRDPNVAFVAALGHAYGANAERGVFRTRDGGKTWEKVLYKDDHTGAIDVVFDPNNANVLLASLWQVMRTPYSLDSGGPGSGLYKSSDGGTTWKRLEGNGLPDGIMGRIGVSVSGGGTWTRQNNQPTAQFYHVIADNRFPYYLYGAQQDNSTIAIATRDTDEWVISDKDWYDVGGGEAGYIAPDPRDGNIVYAGDGGGVVTRFDKRTEQAQSISPWPLDTSGRGAGELEHRFQWTEPVFLSPHDPDVLYTAAEVIFKSADHGASWTTISPDLTRNDQSKQKPSDGPITLDVTSVD